MMKKSITLFTLIITAILIYFFFKPDNSKQITSEPIWRLTPKSKQIVSDPKLRSQIFSALSAAEHTGTDPMLSNYKVRTATVIEKNQKENIILGGNTEYTIPEAIHGEAALINHVTSLYGPDTTHHKLRFVAFFSDHCSTSGSCGDCRDFQKAATDFNNLLVVCGQSSDHTVHITRFRDQLVDENQFPAAPPSALPITRTELSLLLDAAKAAIKGGVTLFTSTKHSAAVALSYSANLYRAAGADDAAFHYRYPIGGALQQAATERDYFIKAILVIGKDGQWPQITYRDRQYGCEFSQFNKLIGKPPIVLIISDGLGHYRHTDFETSLPYAFSTSSFMPESVKNFIQTHKKSYVTNM